MGYGSGVTPVPSNQDLFTRLAHGVLNGYLHRREQDFQQGQINDQRAYETSNRQEARDFQTSQVEDARKYAEGQAKTERDQALSDADRKFRQSLFTYSAEQGSVTPEMLDAIKEIATPQELKLIEGISATSAKRYADEQSLKKQEVANKGHGRFKPADLSTVKADLTAGFGFELSPEAIRAIAAKSDATGLPTMYAAAMVFPDPTKIPHAQKTTSQNLESEGELLGRFAKAHPARMAEIEKMIPNEVERENFLTNMTGYMQPTQDNPEGEKPLDAYRQATADYVAQSLSPELGGADPTTITVPTQAVNEVLKRQNLHPLSDSTAEFSLPGMIDELIRNNAATTPGKGTDLEAIKEIIREALGAEPPPRAGAHARGEMWSPAQVRQGGR